MRLIALLMLPTLGFAAPVPNLKSDIELKLSAENQDVLNITIQNNGKEPLELPYRFSELENFVIELVGEKGKTYKIQRTREKDDKETPGTLTIPAGESKTLSLHTCHSLPELGDSQKVTFTARLKHNGKTVAAEPLTVKP